MRVWSRRMSLAIVGASWVWLIVFAWAGQMAAQAGQAAPPARPPASSATALTSEQAFKNIQALKGIPVDDFMGTMGIMSAALGFDCSECHTNAGTDKVDWALDTPRKRTARRMVEMVATLNRTSFGGRQVVTCWTCHRGRDRPMITPPMEVIYGTPAFETDDLVMPAQGRGQSSAEQILDKYIEAVGGAQRLSGLTSHIATGTSVGFGGFGGEGQVQISAKAPDQRAMVIGFKDNPGRDDAVRTFDGRIGWQRVPLSVLGEYELSGSELDGAKLDAQLSFPGQIKQVLTNWRVGNSTTISDLPAPSSQSTGQPITMFGQDRDVQVVQGTGPRNTLVTPYFDSASGLLLRMIRYGNSPIGRVPTQIDYADYRDVGGIKLPFRMTFAWLDGRDAIQLNEVRTNVPIDAARFGRPAPAKAR
jgi:photosynthetic reaction center cytochrome c subunit